MDAQVSWSIVTFIAGALWTTGGRAALQRRVIEHELDLAQKLDEEPMRSLMAKRAHDRAAIYLARGLESDASRRGLAPLVPLAFGTALLFAATRLPDDTLVWFDISLSLLGTVLLGGGVGAMIYAVFRDWRAWLGTARAKHARRRLSVEAANSAEDQHNRPQQAESAGGHEY
jgi:hypothetical protein